MKKRCKIIIPILILSVILLTCVGCDAITISSTTFGDNTTIEFNQATDGETAETASISFGKDKTFTIASELESGQVKIDVVQVTNMKIHVEDPDDFLYGDTIVSVKVNPGDSSEFTLPGDEYVYQITVIGDTTGKITIKAN